ncbi:hypothetical protein BGZ63DRAFT_366961 [Mariannaea sp. PMI_226]|nr:hypothetical protein BGZ63DRAFT_366961 [Mariannaea sp. PMI_226]
MRISVGYFVSFFISHAALASPGSDPHQFHSVTLPNHEVTQFPVGTWIENIAVRANGNLLLTSLTPNASLYEVLDPACAASRHPKVTRRFTIASITSLLGIAETGDDVFALAGGNFTTTTGGVKGTWGLWAVDFTAKGHNSKPKLITPIPDAVLLNGATSVPQRRKIVLIADSALGLVWRVDTVTRKYDIAIRVPEMKPGSSSPTSIGINGLHIHKGYLYWTNLSTTTFYKIRFTKEGYPARGAKVETVVKLSASRLDDFIFGPGKSNTAWVATNSDNRVFAVEPNGDNIVVAGGGGGSDSNEVPGATACKFGRTRRDAKVLYVTTSGGSTQGGKVQGIDTTGFLNS